MTALTKIVFSAVLLAAGFGLASLFGPPELADRVAEAIRPASPEPHWGALQPLAQDSLSDPRWAEYEAAALRTPSIAAPYAPTTPTVVAAVDASGGEAPLWTPPTRQHRADPAVTTAVAEANPRNHQTRDYAVSTTGWRNPTAPVGWPTQEPITPIDDSTTNAAAVNPAPTYPETAPTPSTSAYRGEGFQSAWPPQERVAPSPQSQPHTPPTSADWPASDWGANATPTLGQPAAAPSQPANPAPWGPSAWPPQGSITPEATAPMIDPQVPAIPVASPSVTPVASNGVAEPNAGLSDWQIPPVDSAKSSEPVRHIVGDGDTLVRLAARYLDDPTRAGDIFLANQPALTHPELLPIGVELVIPSPSSAANGPLGQATPYAGQSNSMTPQARLIGPRPVVAP